MKLWVAKFNLCTVNGCTYHAHFSVTQTEEDDFEVNDGHDEWCSFKRYLLNRIPMNIRCRNITDGYIIEQGFDKEPNEEELKQIKEQMKITLREHLDKEEEYFLMRQAAKILATYMYEVHE